MTSSHPYHLRVAILDMYKGVANVGLNAIKTIVSNIEGLEYEVFNVREKYELPDLDFDIYIGSGGPGDPLIWNENWSPAYYQLIDKLWQCNQNAPGSKPAFFICHSFQMMCHHFGFGEIRPRKSRSIGILPIHLTEDGLKDRLFRQMPNPFYAADSRDYQLVQPNMEQFEKHGAKILALEKIRPHVPLERAIMGVRFSNEWVGVQFHPEADPAGMLKMLENPKHKNDIIKLKGQEKLDKLIQRAMDPTKLNVTYQRLLPQFLKESILSLNVLETMT